MSEKHTLRGQFAADDGSRQIVLNRAAECSRLTDPTVLPFLDQGDVTKKDQGRPLPQNYQSLGSEGVITLEGKMLAALFPPGLPWFKLDLAVEIKNSPAISDEDKQALLHDLMVQELIIVSALESGDTGAGQEFFNTFRTAKRQELCQLIVTGDVLSYINDEYKLTVYNRRQYVTKRNSRGDVLYHIIRETIDPLTLTEKQLTASKLNKEDLKKKHVAERMCEIYTNVEWMPSEKHWRIQQEVADEIINTSTETVSPYFSTPFKLTPGEDYGRGLVELHLGDLYSFDEGSLRFLDFMELCSRMLTVLDSSSQMRERDFAKPTGSVIRGRVVGGIVQDAAMFKADKVADFKVCAEVMARIEQRLGKVFLTASNAVRDSERTTAYEVARATIAELEGALGGVYAPISDYQQIPLLNRVVWMLRRDKRLPLPEEGKFKAIKITTLTGIAALADQRRADQLRELVADAAALGEMGIAKLNMGVILDAIARYRRINEPGAIKSNQQVAQEREEAIAAATKLAANEKAIDVAGNVAESKLTAGTK